MAFNIHDLTEILNQLKDGIAKAHNQPTIETMVEATNVSVLVAERPKRCQGQDCKAKIVLSDFACQCNKFYCSRHRHAENHSCSFDYRNAGTKGLEKNLVKVVADKLERI
jgi:hypothetical protein